MPRYIDADELKEWVVNWLYKDRYYHNGRVSRTIPTTELYDILKQIPTPDVVEVVRCENCKHRDADDFCTGRGYPNALVPDDGFCDKGKRRE